MERGSEMSRLDEIKKGLEAINKTIGMSPHRKLCEAYHVVHSVIQNTYYISHHPSKDPELREWEYFCDPRRDFFYNPNKSIHFLMTKRPDKSILTWCIRPDAQDSLRLHRHEIGDCPIGEYSKYGVTV